MRLKAGVSFDVVVLIFGLAMAGLFHAQPVRSTVSIESVAREKGSNLPVEGAGARPMLHRSRFVLGSETPMGEGVPDDCGFGFVGEVKRECLSAPWAPRFRQRVYNVQ